MIHYDQVWQLGYKDGLEFFVVVNEAGTIELIPYIEDIHEQKGIFSSPEEVLESYRKSRLESIEIENRNFNRLHEKIFGSNQKSKNNEIN